MPSSESVLLFGGARYLSLQSPTLPTNNFTFSFRFQSTAAGTAIYYGDYDFQSYTTCFFAVTIEANGVRVRLYNNVGKLLGKRKDGGPLLDGQVHYVAVTFKEDLATGNTLLSVFIDGNLTPAPQPIALRNAQGQVLTIRPGSTVFVATAPPRGTAQEDQIRESDLFAGTLTNLNMWSAPLGVDDLVRHFQTAMPIRENVLCLSLPLDTDSYDYQVAAFADGSSAQVNAQSSIMPNSTHCFGGVQSFTGFPLLSRTFETWIRCGNDSSGKALLSYGDVSRTDQPDNGGDAWILHNPENLQVNKMPTQLDLADGQWHHLAVVTEVTAGSEPGNNTGKDTVYVDGVLKYSGISQNVNQIDAQPFLLGSGYWDDNAQVFQGAFQDVKLWNTARTAAQIADSFQQTPFNAPNEKQNGLVAYWSCVQGGTDVGPTLSYDVTRYSKNIDELPNQVLAASQTPVLSVDTDLLENYKHAQLMEEQHSFQALQTAEGHALFFSIGTDGIFYVTIESSGSQTGWNKIDLSSDILQDPVSKALYQPKMFKVAQNVSTGAINIVLVLGSAVGDYTYTAWNLPNDDATWNAPLDWIYQKFDAPSTGFDLLVIHDVQVLESAAADFIVVDISLPFQQEGALFRRYFLDLRQPAGSVWSEHDLSINFDGALYSALGKRAAETGEGTYTLGAVVDHYQLLYTPLTVGASGTELLLPQTTGAALSSYAIATAPNGTSGETNLFVAGNKQLIFFASDQQQAGSAGQAVDLPASNVLMNVNRLGSHTSDTHVFVWGLNQQGSLFYTQCAKGQELQKGAWDTPAIILTNAAMATAYLNAADQSHVLFAFTTDKQLLQLSQDGETANWSRRNIVLPAMTTDDVIELNTYTSHVLVTDALGMPQAEVPVAITSTTPVSVYVNDIYTILSPTLPLNITTDQAGTLTIIQETTGLTAIAYTFKIQDMDPQVINPMAGVLDTMSRIQSGQDLLNVRIPDEQNNPVPLLDPAKVNKATADALANVIRHLNDASQKLPADGSKPVTRQNRGLRLASAMPQTRQVLGRVEFGVDGMAYHAPSSPRFAAASPGMIMAEESLTGEIIGDLWGFFTWVKDEVSSVFDAIKDFTIELIGDVLGFVFRIAGKVFIFLIDCLVSAVNAFMNFLDWVGVDTHKLRKWLGFVFNWEDILLTHKVFNNLFTTFIDHNLQSIKSYEDQFLKTMADAEQYVKNWAGIGERLPDDASHNTGRNVGAGSQPMKGQNSPAFNLLNYHLKHNAGSTNVGPNQVPGISVDDSRFDILMKGMAQLQQNFEDLMDSLHPDALKGAPDLSFKDLIVKLTGFMASEIIEIARIMLAEIFKLVNDLLQNVRDLLVTPLEIPVLSYLYKNKITQGEDLTILGVASLISALPATVFFKVAFGTNVFSGPEADKYIQAKDFSVFQAAFTRPARPATRSANAAFSPGAFEKWTVAASVLGMISSVAISFVSALAKIPTKNGQSIISDNPVIILNGILYLPYVFPGVVAGFGTASDMESWDVFDVVMIVTGVCKAMIDIRMAGLDIQKPETSKSWQKASPWLDLAINGIWLIPSIMACAAKKNKNPTPTFQENMAASFFFDFSGMLSPVLANVKNPYVLAAGVVGTVVFNILYGSLTAAASARIYGGEY